MTNATDFNGRSFFDSDHLKWLYFSPQGRANRQRYWVGNLVLIPPVIIWIILASALFAAGSVGAVIGGLLFATLYVALVIIAIMLLIKRAHDRNHTGWYILLTMIPLLGIIWQIELYFFPGTPGQNQYGNDPRT